MGKQMIKRILKAVLYVFIIVTLVFLLMRQMPIETYFVGHKPVIYLYPEETTEVTVELDLPGELTCTYPAYEDGWRVTAAPDGTLTDGKGQTYNYLYWEGETATQYDLSEGFCVAGADTAAFLEEALAQLGLTRDDITYEVLALPKTGFLGIGAQPAKVQGTYEAPDPVPEAPKVALSSASRSKPKPAPAKKPGAPKPEAPKPEAPKQEAPKAEPVKPEVPKAPKTETPKAPKENKPKAPKEN